MGGAQSLANGHNNPDGPVQTACISVRQFGKLFAHPLTSNLYVWGKVPHIPILIIPKSIAICNNKKYSNFKATLQVSTDLIPMHILAVESVLI